MAFQEFSGQLDQEAPSGPVQEFTGEMDSPEAQSPPVPEPTIGQVALNAVPKGVANLVNVPHALNGLVIRGLASLPGLDAVPEVKKFLQGIADNPEFNRNHPMEFMQKIGAVRPENEPQTGLQRIVDSAIQAATGAAALGGGAVGSALGAFSGATSQTVKEETGSDALALAAGIAAPYAAGKAVNAVAGAANKLRGANQKVLLEEAGKQTFQKAHEMGFVVEPSKVRSGSDLVESVAGKARIAQETVERNAGNFTTWAKRAIGLPDDAPLSRDLLRTYKDTVIKPYKEIDQLFQQAKATGTLPWFPRYHSANLTDEFVQANQDAQSLWRTYRQSAVKDINLLKEAKAADQRVESIVKDIETVANHVGVPDFKKKIMAAKELYAKVNDVETALNPGSGHVSPQILATLRHESNKLTGALKDLGDIALTFPRSFREIEKSAPSGVSGTDAGMGATLATVGSAASGSVTGAAAGGLPLLRGPAVEKVLTPEYQRSLADIPPKKYSGASKSAIRSAVVGTASSRQEEKK